jgi:hypothetical protein
MLAAGQSTTATVASQLTTNSSGLTAANQITAANLISLTGRPLASYTAPPVQIEAGLSSIPNTYDVYADNTSSGIISYSGLEVFTHADDTLFTPTEYIPGMFQTGTLTATAVPPQGILAPGPTLLALVDPPPPASVYYDGGVINIDGASLAMAAEIQPLTPVPEPSGTVLCLSALPFLALFLGYRRFRGARIPTSA